MARRLNSENKDGGYIKLYRKMLDSVEWKCGTVAAKITMITLLLMANHEANKWMWKGEVFQIKPGQLITSYQSLEEKTGLTKKQLRGSLEFLERAHYIRRERAGQGQLITVEKWGVYQGHDSEEGRPRAHFRADLGHSLGQTQGTLRAPNKNDKECLKNDKESLSEETSEGGWERVEKKRADASSILELLSDKDYAYVSKCIPGDDLISIVDEIDAAYGGSFDTIRSARALIVKYALDRGLMRGKE